MNTYLFVSDRGPVAFVEGTDNTLNDLQRLVDGYVEVQVTQHGEDAWFNEEGLTTGIHSDLGLCPSNPCPLTTSLR